MERNPYADAIGRESVAKARRIKAAQTRTKTRELPPDDILTGTKHGNSRLSPPTTAADTAVADGLADDPTGMGGGMGATVVQRW